MKKIISVLIVAIMIISTIAAVIPASAANATYIPDIPGSSYIAYDKAGNVLDLGDGSYHGYFRTTKIGDVLAAKRTKDGNAAAYISTMQFKITSTTKYEYEVYARNNQSGRYAGVPFAISPDKKVYFAYGAFDNNSDNVSGESYIITSHGAYNNYYPSTSDTLGSEYHETLQQDTFDYTVNNGGGTTKDVTAPFATLKFVYDGLTVKVYAKDVTGTFVQMGHDVELASGSKLVFGIYSRESTNMENRTCAIKEPKITGLNAEALGYMNDAGAGVDAGAAEEPGEYDSTELESVIEEAIALNEEDYTVVTYKMVMNALAEAEALLESGTATQSEIDAMTETLSSRIQQLVLAEDSGDSGDSGDDEEDYVDPDDEEDVDAGEEDEENTNSGSNDKNTDKKEDTDGTKNPAETKPATAQPSVQDLLPQKGGAAGCGASVAATAGVIALVAAFGTALVIKKKD